MDVGDSRAASFEVVYVHRGVAVHGIHEVWLCRASFKFCPSVVLVRASELTITDLRLCLSRWFLGRKKVAVFGAV